MNFAAISTAILASLALASSVSAQSVDPYCDFGPDGVNNSLGFKDGGPWGEAPRACFDVGGVERCYYTYIPSSCRDSTETVPLVVDTHGTNNCPGTLVQYTGWVEKAEEECLVILMPSSSMDSRFVESCFNLEGGAEDPSNAPTAPCCCREASIPSPFYGAYDEPDDAAFVKMAIDDALARFPIDGTGLSLDPNRVYMAGHSNGCMTSMSVAAKYSDTVAAVCCHAGAIITGFDPDEYNPVPIWMVSGALDNLVLYDGITLPFPGLGPRALWSHDTMYNYLLVANGCESSDVTPNDQGSVRTGGSCTNGATVQFVTLDASGHDPYNTFWNPIYGGNATTVDTTALAWDFCKSYSNPTPSPTTAPTKAGKSTKRPKSAKHVKR